MLLVSPFPDETLYGLMARNGRLRGDTIGSTTSQAFFDHPDAGLHHDFPHHLEQLAINTRGHLGSVQAIMAQMTAAPYFLRFKPISVERATQDAMAGTSIARLKHALGLPASPCRARLSLRACPQCMDEDLGQHGITSWRRKHQLPGSLLCSLHAVPLLKSSLRIDRRGKSKFLLPEDAGVFERVESLQLNGDNVACLHRLAKLNTQILECCLSRNS
ncbi:MAG: TniQ family protein [Rhodocyclaceae bacterium]|nr:TniQ family protein [Rhodocyclaceae bacterium]